MLGTLELGRNSDWATIVASIVVMDEMNQGTLVAQPIYGPELWLDFFLKRTKNVPLSRACQEFLDWLRATLVRVVKTQGPLPPGPDCLKPRQPAGAPNRGERIRNLAPRVVLR